jgi:hypothetical protein
VGFPFFHQLHFVDVIRTYKAFQSSDEQQRMGIIEAKRREIVAELRRSDLFKGVWIPSDKRFVLT